MTPSSPACFPSVTIWLKSGLPLGTDVGDMKRWRGLRCLLRKYAATPWLHSLLAFLERRLRSKSLALRVMEHLVPEVMYASCTTDGLVHLWIGTGLGDPRHLYTTKLISMPRTPEGWEPLGESLMLHVVQDKLVLLAGHGTAVSLPLWKQCNEHDWRNFSLAEGISSSISEKRSVVICSQEGQLLRLDADLCMLGHTTVRTNQDHRADRHSRHWLLTSANALYSAGACATRIRCWTADLHPLTVLWVPLPLRGGLFDHYDRGILQIYARPDGDNQDFLYVTIAEELQLWRVSLTGAPSLVRRLTTPCWTGRIICSPWSSRALVLGESIPQLATGRAHLLLLDLDERGIPHPTGSDLAASQRQVNPVQARAPFTLYRDQVGWIHWGRGGAQELHTWDLGEPGGPHTLAHPTAARGEGRSSPTRDICAFSLSNDWGYSAFRDILDWGEGED